MTQITIDRMFAAMAPVSLPERINLERIKFGARRYLPQRDFPQLFPQFEALPDRDTRIAVLRLVRNAERERGRAGAWNYSFNRLIAYRAALLAERLARARDNRMAREAV